MLLLPWKEGKESLMMEKTMRLCSRARQKLPPSFHGGHPWGRRKEKQEEEERTHGKRRKRRKEKKKEKSTTHSSLAKCQCPYWPCGFNELRWRMTWHDHLMNFSSTIPICSFAATEFSHPIWRRIWLKFYPRVGYQATYPIYCKNWKFFTVKARATDKTRFWQLTDFSSLK